MFDERIIEAAIAAWMDDPTAPDGRAEGVTEPSRSVVRLALEVCFLASLRSEEGRSVSFSVALLDRTDAGRVLGEKARHGNSLRFQPPPSLSVESIVKLAPAFDPETGAFAVGRPDAHGEFCVWGVLHFSPPSNRFTDPLYVGSATGSRPPALLSIHVRQPGSLIFARGSRQVGRLSNGVFGRAQPTPLTDRSLGRFLVERVERHPAYEKHGQRYWGLYREAVDLLISEAARRSHGSTILLVPETRTVEHSAHWLDRYRFVGPYGLSELLTALLESEAGEDLLDLPARRRIADRIGAVAQLSCIDGALVLTDRLDLLSFGATLAAPLWTGDVAVGPDAFGLGGGDPFPVSTLGTRHQSAINFVGHCPGTIACVISRDGPVRAFLRQGSKRVFCWPDCSVSMFV